MVIDHLHWKGLRSVAIIDRKVVMTRRSGAENIV